MDLFEHLNSEPHNLLPYNGEVFYYGKILTQEQANYYFHALMEKIAWENDKAMIMGKEIITRRKVAWYGDAPFSYIPAQLKPPCPGSMNYWNSNNWPKPKVKSHTTPVCSTCITLAKKV
jgi:hypothetical protein